MKKCIVVSDSFKGTLSSQEICTLAAQRLEAYFPGCEVVRIPVADGGEGTVACFHEACGGTLVSVPVSGPYGEAITAEYLQLPGGQAVIEMASVGDVQPFGHLDDGVDGGVALPLLHVGQDGLADPRLLGQLPQGQAALRPQLLQIHGDDLSQIPIHLLAPFPVDKYIEQL